MKTVTGKVISAEPFSISKAASILSKFASSENGATQAVSAYLRRTSAAFNELKGLHRGIKVSSLKEKKPRSDVTLERDPTRGSGEPNRSNDVSWGICDGIQKKKHKKKEESDGVGELVGNGDRESKTVTEEEPLHGRVEASQGPSQDGASETKEGKKNKNKKNTKDRKEAGDVEGGKVTAKGKAEDVNRKGEKMEKKKRRKSDGEMVSEEKKSRKKRRVEELDN
ncbi:PREDICTED: protein FAM133-like [Tarenaya hassleriana]|uniref:protein FAM133-like n=1 Tax=Tarenaya hassleriana TaxID=28532 RepID=UPI00053C4E95|nr:PREDICTED: protein FAM133-like [Tarenaya hassleriana]